MTSDATEAAASAGRALAALRHSQSYTCAVCGQPFDAKRRTGPAEPRYCSEACKQRAKYRRERQRATTCSASTV